MDKAIIAMSQLEHWQFCVVAGILYFYVFLSKLPPIIDSIATMQKNWHKGEAR